MPCNPEELKHVQLFQLLDDDELAVLAAQVEVRQFAARQRIFKIGDPPEKAYVLTSGSVRVSMIDQEHQEVVVDARSFLCTADYCARYLVGSRGKAEVSSAASNLGFRLAMNGHSFRGVIQR